LINLSREGCVGSKDGLPARVKQAINDLGVGAESGLHLLEYRPQPRQQRLKKGQIRKSQVFVTAAGADLEAVAQGT
jgi:hypothetical protein